MRDDLPSRRPDVADGCGPSLRVNARQRARLARRIVVSMLGLPDGWSRGAGYLILASLRSKSRPSQ
jgi:hypothetical protein